GLAHRAGTGPPNPAARGHPARAGPAPPSPPARGTAHPDRGRRRSARPVRPVAAAPRRPAPARRPGLATAHHRPRTAAAAPRPPLTARSARPARPGTGPARLPRAARTRPPARRAADPADAPAGPAAARTADGRWRTPAPSLIPLLRPGPPACPPPPRPHAPAA